MLERGLRGKQKSPGKHMRRQVFQSQLAKPACGDHAVRHESVPVWGHTHVLEHTSNSSSHLCSPISSRGKICPFSRKSTSSLS